MQELSEIAEGRRVQEDVQPVLAACSTIADMEAAGELHPDAFSEVSARVATAYVCAEGFEADACSEVGTPGQELQAEFAAEE